MLVRITSFILVSFSLFAKSSFIKEEGQFILVTNQKLKYSISYNSKPKILKEYRKGSLLIIDYDSGDYGTKKIVSIYRRAVINTLNNKLIIDAPFEYSDHKQVKWKFDLKNKKITVKDLIEGNKKKSFK